MKRLFISTAIIVAMVNFSNAKAQVPRLVHYQGLLKSADGSPINGRRDLSFAIYKSPLAEEPIWSEVHESVEIDNGSYHVMLGSQNPLNLSFFEYFLEVRLDGEAASEPRTRIVGSGYNFRLWFLFAAYTVVWLGIFGYLISISRRQKRIIVEMQAIQAIKS